MADLLTRIEGRAGRLTLNRPQALNALSHAMCLEIDAALRGWRDDPAVAVVMIDADSPRAFSAGGDLAKMYATGQRGDYDYGRRFWRDEYRMNARLAEYPKPVVSFLHGFVMGGGVGVGCHARLRIAGESVQVAMPECAIGLVPDVGGSRLLARAPGRLGEYLATTGARMGPADALLAGFADAFLPEADWPALKAKIAATGRLPARADLGGAPPGGRLAALRPKIDAAFSAPTLPEVLDRLAAQGGPFAEQALDSLSRAAPLSAVAAFTLLRRLRPDPTIRQALELEHRFTFRAMIAADFLEGIRAQIVDKDRRPRWRHADIASVPGDDVAAILAPLGPDTLTFATE